jgi:hypothetical protein
MASGFTMAPTITRHAGKGEKLMATGKKSSNKPAGKQKIQAGPGGKMNKFDGAVAQKPGVSATTKGSGKGAPFPQGGPSGKMHKFEGVKAVKKA